ncbi:MAG TPA: hypothetical protein VGY54_08300 [Polyangiaceae bacterium]|nr:hypothetical protein [Polyangiaceae bacterium]
MDKCVNARGLNFRTAFFGFGFHAFGVGNAFSLYYDDIVLDTKRVNCLP